MNALTHHDMVIFLLQIGVILLAAQLFGELFKKFKQPSVIGEIMAGVVLGPSVLGLFAPEAFATLFTESEGASIALGGLTQVGVLLLLFVAGMEVELPMIWKYGRSAAMVSLLGMILPFGMGFGGAWLMYDWLYPAGDGPSRLLFATFVATALSISALPVIAKTLIDLGLLGSRIGLLVISAAMINDFFGWILFSVVLSAMRGDDTGVGQTVGLTLGFALGVLTVGRRLIHLTLRLVKRYLTPVGATITLAMMCSFFGGVATEWIGVHAIFGAFLMGIAFGDSAFFDERAKEAIHQFIIYIFAPLFFVSIGLQVNFVTSFNPLLTLVLFTIACVSKVLGGYLGGVMGGLPKREALAVGFGLNARGAMEIILGLVAREAGLIGDEFFVALVVMAILTSAMSGSAMQWALRRA